jgi:hypothetical protein
MDERYQTLPFPFDELPTPKFEISADWNLHQLAGFLERLSATQRYQAEHNQHPLKLIWADLVELWGDAAQRRSVHWPLYLRVGRVQWITIGWG